MEKTYKILKMVLLALVFVALLLGAKRLYDTLGSQVHTNSLATQSTATAETEKEPVPDFTVYDLEGNAYKLSDFRGKPVILNFWATWCGYCKREMPDFQEKYQQYGEDIHFLMVNVTDGARETVETASGYVQEQGFSFPVFYDTTLEATTAYQANGLPVSYFIDAEGNLVVWQQGMLTADTLQRGIDILIG